MLINKRIPILGGMQPLMQERLKCLLGTPLTPVSYTHLDVYKRQTKGFVITRMTTAQITAIVSPQEGMMVYDTVAKCLKLYDGTVWSCFSTPACP